MKKILIIINLIIVIVSCAFAGEYESKIPDLEKSVVAICINAPHIKNIKGTGFIVSSDGLVITANHVITDRKGKEFKNMFALRPTHPNVEKYKIDVVRRFSEGLEGRDIALLRLSSEKLITNLPFIPIADSVSAGEPVVIIGFPLVFSKVYIWPLLRKGVVASTRYKHQNSKILILDLPIVHGFSGSPVISIKNFGAVGVIMGGSKKNKTSDFSLAAVLLANDIKPID